MDNNVPVKKNSPNGSMFKKNIRRWILKAVTLANSKGGVTFHHIKKYLDAKQTGLSEIPETKLMLKKLIETGHLHKRDGKYAVKKHRPSKGAKSCKRSGKSKKGSKASKRGRSSRRRSGKGRLGSRRKR